MTRFEPSLVQIGRTVRPVAFVKKPKKRKKEKKRQWQTGYLPDHPRRRTKVKVCMPGGLRCVVLYFKLFFNRYSGFATVGGRKSPFPITLAIGLYNSWYYRTSRDDLQMSLKIIGNVIIR